jgi:hypothetical protein
MGFSRLQGLGPRYLPWHEYQCLPGFVPFQRHHQDHATAGIPAPVLPAPRFSQPLSEPTFSRLAGLFHPAGTPRVRPSESDPKSIGARFQALAPSPLATSQGVHPVVRSALIRGTAPRCYAFGTLHIHQLLAPCGAGFPHRFRPTLKLFARSGAPRHGRQFHPPAAVATLLTFPPSGYSPIITWNLAVQPSRGSSPLRVCWRHQWHFHLAVAPTLLAFVPYGRELSLQPTWIPRSLFPFRLESTVTGRPRHLLWNPLH